MGRAVRNLVEFVGGLLTGVVIGYTAALFLAPYEGAESRARLREGAGTLAERPRQMADDVQARVQRAVEQGKIAAAQARAELEEASGRPAEDFDQASGPTTI
jgi:gas vesicle protein